MSFGLCNAFATFQSYINNSLQEYLNQFTTTYLNDVLIYSEFMNKHREEILKVLKELRERELALDIDKCEFNVEEVKYLKMYVEINEVRMNPKKVDTVLK